MALLSKTNQEKYLKALGFKDVLSFQKAAFKKYPKEWDNKYGTKTDNALRTWYNTYKYTKNFKPEDFRCTCDEDSNYKGVKCGGYPTYMKASILKDIQTIRSHWGKPVTITCGMRCKNYNRFLNGSISNSKHLQGLALDFYQKGVTDTLANRKKAIKYIKKLAKHTYSYGNGITSTGAYINAPYMGNALHVDCSK